MNGAVLEDHLVSSGGNACFLRGLWTVSKKMRFSRNVRIILTHKKSQFSKKELSTFHQLYRSFN